MEYSATVKALETLGFIFHGDAAPVAKELQSDVLNPSTMGQLGARDPTRATDRGRPLDAEAIG